MNNEIPIVFRCRSTRLLGILHTVSPPAEIGVVVVVGGPQYRVGSHRQFVLMARRIAAAGFPVLRFDYRGMGDADGDMRTFVDVDNDIRAAVDCLIGEVTSVKRIVLLGLCDAASANLMFAPNDRRVTGLILLNPWVRTVASEARTYLRHYYVKRLFQISFWRKIFAGNWAMTRSLSGLKDSLRNVAPVQGKNDAPKIAGDEQFIVPMLRGLKDFQGKMLILISGRDLTAQEFIDLCSSDWHWKKAIGRSTVSLKKFPKADHTMSERRDLYEATDACVSWLQQRV